MQMKTMVIRGLLDETLHTKKIPMQERELV